MGVGASSPTDETVGGGDGQLGAVEVWHGDVGRSVEVLVLAFFGDFLLGAGLAGTVERGVEVIGAFAGSGRTVWG